MQEDGDLPVHVDCLLSKLPRISEIRATLRRLVRQPKKQKEPA
jgi:hypothetical protein